MTTDGSESNQQSTNDAKLRGRGAMGRRHDEGQRMHTTIKQIMRRGGVVGDDDEDNNSHEDEDDDDDDDDDGGCGGQDGHHRMGKGRGHNDTTIK
jgi:hypothetical protein